MSTQLGKVKCRFTDDAGSPFVRKTVIATLKGSSIPVRVYTENGTLLSASGFSATDDNGIVEFWAETSHPIRLGVLEPGTSVELTFLSEALPGSFDNTVTQEQLKAFVYVGPTPPPDPPLNQLWVDTS